MKENGAMPKRARKVAQGEAGGGPLLGKAKTTGRAGPGMVGLGPTYKVLVNLRGGRSLNRLAPCLEVGRLFLFFVQSSELSSFLILRWKSSDARGMGVGGREG